MQRTNVFDLKSYLEKEKNKFLDKKHLEWYVATFHREYESFLKMDYEKALKLAKEEFQDEHEYLTKYISELNKAYLSAKEFLRIDELE